MVIHGVSVDVGPFIEHSSLKNALITAYSEAKIAPAEFYSLQKKYKY